jgi:hypothetical protein
MEQPMKANEFQGGAIVIGVDPGKTTGLAIVEALGSVPFASPAGRVIQVRWGMQILDASDVPWNDRFVITDIIAAWFKQVGNVWVVCEAFNLYAHAAQSQINSDFPSVQIIGMLQAEMHRLNRYDRLIMQPASTRKPIQIKGEYKQPLQGLHHAKDAFKHARYFIITQKDKLFDHEATKTLPTDGGQPSEGTEHPTD